MSRLRRRIFPVFVAIGVIFVAALVFRAEPEATWLAIEGPASAISGELYVGTITLRDPQAGQILDFDLHGSDTKKRSLGCVAVGGSHAVDPSQASYVFTFRVPSRTDLARVHGVIYLSPTGKWADHTAVARSGPIRVFATADATVHHVRSARLAVHDDVHDPGVTVNETPAVRAVGTVLWLMSAAWAWRMRSTRTDARSFPALTILCLCGALWEATAPGTAIGDLARSIAREYHLYEDRRWLQRGATVAAVGLLGVFAAVAVQRSRQRAPALSIAGLCLYGAVVVSSMLSLHEVDRLLASSLFGLQFASLLRIIAIVAVLLGLRTRLAAAPDRATIS